MGIEIERKFLVKHELWKSAADQGRYVRQGYLLSDEEKTVRIRMIGDKAFLTIKGPINGISRMEFEYGIPCTDAEALLELCETQVEKIRYLVSYADSIWEVDVFCGANDGLVLAEIELESEGQNISLPEWAGEEVTDDLRYYNACLAKHPFTRWS